MVQASCFSLFAGPRIRRSRAERGFRRFQPRSSRKPAIARRARGAANDNRASHTRIAPREPEGGWALSVKTFSPTTDEGGRGTLACPTAYSIWPSHGGGTWNTILQEIDFRDVRALWLGPGTHHLLHCQVSLLRNLRVLETLIVSHDVDISLQEERYIGEGVVIVNNMVQICV